MKLSGLHLSKNYIPSPKTLFTDLSNITFNVWFGKWHEEYGKFFLEHSKLGFWWDALIQIWKSMSLKSKEELSVMTMKNYTKFEEELTCHFKVDMRNLTNFDRSTLNSKKFHFNGVLLSKVYIVWGKKVQTSYLSWKWRGMQNLEWNQLFVSQLT